MGIHSALAIKRQRRLREQAKKRALERRLSSRTNSVDSMEHLPTKTPHLVTTVPDHRLATSIGMLHIGVCFMVSVGAPLGASNRQHCSLSVLSTSHANLVPVNLVLRPFIGID